MLLREPGAGEWSIVEIAGHMVDVATIFNDRLRVHLNLGPADPDVAEKIPWLLTRERAWRDHSIDEIVSTFRHEVVACARPARRTSTPTARGAIG